MRIHDENYNLALTENGLYFLKFRYLKTLENGEYEPPIEMFRRVAWNLAKAEERFDPQIKESEVAKIADSFFCLMTDGYFLPNAPTLLGAGRPLQQLFACFVLPVEDSIDGISDIGVILDL